MSIAKPFTFVANTYAKASEVNANFDTVYSQVNTNISDIARNATDIDNLENNKANINGSTSQVFAVADPTSNNQAVNKQYMLKSIGNSLDFISGLTITKDSGSPEDTIIVSPGSCYDSTHAVILSLDNSTSKQNLNQGANATYYVYIIGNSTGSLIDILISQSNPVPGLPTGYSLYRQIGKFTTDSDNKIDTVSYYGTSSTSDKSGANIISGIMPDYSAGVNKDFSTAQNHKIHTAESDGWLELQTINVGTASPTTISINGETPKKINSGGSGNTSDIYTFIPFHKDDTYEVITNGGSGFMVYYPIIGVTNA